MEGQRRGRGGQLAFLERQREDGRRRGKVGGVCCLSRGSLRGEEGLSWRPADGPLQTIEADRCSHKEQRPHTRHRHTHFNAQKPRAGLQIWILSVEMSEAAVHLTATRGSNTNWTEENLKTPKLRPLFLLKCSGLKSSRHTFYWSRVCCHHSGNKLWLMLRFYSASCFNFMITYFIYCLWECKPLSSTDAVLCLGHVIFLFVSFVSFGALNIHKKT